MNLIDKSDLDSLQRSCLKLDEQFQLLAQTGNGAAMPKLCIFRFKTVYILLFLR